VFRLFADLQAPFNLFLEDYDSAQVVKPGWLV
jgi:hypothetical protein